MAMAATYAAVSGRRIEMNKAPPTLGAAQDRSGGDGVDGSVLSQTLLVPWLRKRKGLCRPPAPTRGPLAVPLSTPSIQLLSAPYQQFSDDLGIVLQL
jgi:hypothetical protein